MKEKIGPPPPTFIIPPGEGLHDVILRQLAFRATEKPPARPANNPEAGAGRAPVEVVLATEDNRGHRGRKEGPFAVFLSVSSVSSVAKSFGSGAMTKADLREWLE